MDVPLHTLYCLELHPYGTDYTMYEYDENLDWFVKAEPEHQKNVKEVGVVLKNGNILWSQQLHQLQSLVLSVCRYKQLQQQQQQQH